MTGEGEEAGEATADRREGLPEELLALARLHPRATWEASARLGPLARFWLERHAMFRRLDAMIREAADAAAEGRIDPAAFRPWLARHLGIAVAGLEEHHAVEDRRYFPIFRRAEPRLAPGFELLERDHDAIHAAIERVVERANVLLAPPPLADAAALRDALARFRDAHAEHGRALLRHLDDEEDLVVPLLIERGEDGALGAGGG